MKPLLLLLMLFVSLAGCQSAPQRPSHTVQSVDLDRFMGSWFVIAHIPLWPERNAWNAVEHYQRLDENRIRTTFSFREGGPDGKIRRYTPTAFVDEEGGNAIWDMQFLWPFRADFRVVWLSEDYRLTIIGRQKRDYAWIMAREPRIPEDEFERMRRYLAEQGYPLEKLRRVPQQWQDGAGYDQPGAQPGD